MKGLIIFVLLFSAFRLQGQNAITSERTIDSTIRFKKWEIGYELLPILYGSIPQQLIFKRYLNTRPNFAYRLRIGLNGFNTSSRNSRSTNPPGSSQSSDGYSFDGFIRLGMEKNRAYNKLILFYGLDLLARQQKDRSEGGAPTQPNSVLINRQTDLRVGIVPFVGLKYKIYPNLFLSIEGSATLLLNLQKSTTELYTGNFLNSRTENESKFISYYFSSVNFFYLSEYF